MRERRHAEDCLSVLLLRGTRGHGQSQRGNACAPRVAGERKETLEGVRGGAPASEGNGGAMAYTIDLCFIEILTTPLVILRAPRTGIRV